MSIFDTTKTKYIAHRGFRPMAPENSLPSFYYAGLLGQWAIETDLHLTADGEVVCCHNESIEKYCNAEGYIRDMTYAELQKFPIVNGKRAACFTDEERRIPRLEEYLEICRRFGSVPFIELKTDDTAYILHRIRKCGFGEGEIVVSSTVQERLECARAEAKGAFLHLIFARDDQLEGMSRLGNAGVSRNIPDPNDCTPRDVELPRELGLRVCLRAADSLAYLTKMRELGLDYFPTNILHDPL